MSLVAHVKLGLAGHLYDLDVVVLHDEGTASHAVFELVEGSFEVLEIAKPGATVKPGQVGESSEIVEGVALDSEASLFLEAADLDCKHHVAFVVADLD